MKSLITLRAMQARKNNISTNNQTVLVFPRDMDELKRRMRGVNATLVGDGAGCHCHHVGHSGLEAETSEMQIVHVPNGLR